MTTSITSAFPPETLRQHGLTIDEYERIKQLLGQREPTLTELGIFSVMWSEHCSYKSSPRAPEAPAHTRATAWCKGRAKMPASSTWATAGPAPSKSRSHNHPQLHRAVSGRGHRRGRNPARHFHHGRAAAGGDGFAALRTDRRSSRDTEPELVTKNHSIVEGVVSGIAGYGNCFGVPNLGGETKFEPCYSRQSAGECVCARAGARRTRSSTRKATGDGQSGDLCGREDGTRRHPRRHHGQRGIQRGIGSQAAQRAGRRSVHGEAAARSLPRSHADRRHRRHSGHGRGRAHLLHLRDGRRAAAWASRSNSTACRSAKPA